MKLKFVSFAVLMASLNVSALTPMPPMAVLIQESNDLGNFNFNAEAQQIIGQKIGEMVMAGHVKMFTQTNGDVGPHDVRKVICIEFEDSHMQSAMKASMQEALAAYSYDVGGNIEVLDGSQCR